LFIIVCIYPGKADLRPAFSERARRARDIIADDAHFYDQRWSRNEA